MSSLPFSLFVVFVLGVCLGALANWAAYAFAWTPRPISPWSRRAADAPPRTWRDRLPLAGWLSLRREAPLHGSGFWVRPLFVEFALGVGLAALYWWEVDQQGLIAPQLAPAGIAAPLAVSRFALLAPFFSHALLITLMTAASLVDLDEKIIPDEFTVPGTLLGLAIATLMPLALLPHVDLGFQPAPGHVEIPAPPGVALDTNQAITLEPTTVNAPQGWPPSLLGERSWQGLILAQACYALWCFALTPRIWRGRRGLVRGMQVIAARILRELCRPPLAIIGLAGLLAITVVWSLGGPAWVGLSTALVGMIGGGALVWATRIIGSRALGVEAMGFGDVTLMMMVGAFLGWQAGVIVFFVAPFAGLIAGLVQLLLRRGNMIPYGPYLCLGALFVIVRWGAVWAALQDVFAAGWLIPAMLAVVMALLYAMLVILRVVKSVLGWA